MSRPRPRVFLLARLCAHTPYSKSRYWRLYSMKLGPRDGSPMAYAEKTVCAMMT